MSGNTSASGGVLTPVTPDITDDALLDIFTGLIAGITSIDGTLVRPKWQLKPPKRPDALTNWCAVGITDTEPDAGPVIAHDANADGGLGQDTYIRHADVTVLASFYGPNSRGNATLLRDGLGMPQNTEDLQANNSISFVSTGTIRAVPESVNMQWIMRHDILLYFRRAIVRSYAVQNIETAGVTSTFDDITTSVNIVP